MRFIATSALLVGAALALPGWFGPVLETGGVRRILTRRR